MSTKFVEFTNANTQKPVWVNPDFVRNAQPVHGHDDWTKLAMGGEGQDVAVEGGLKSVLEKLMGKSEHARALDEHLTWTQRPPEVD